MDIPIIKKIIFDVDGPLLNTPNLLLQELYAIAQSLGLNKPAMEKIIAAWGKNLHDFLSIALPGVSLEVFVTERDRLGFFRHQPIRVPGARKVLVRLSQAYSLSILTNRSKDSLLQLMTRAEIDLNYFRFIITASDLPPEFHKPSPKAFTGIIQALFSEGVLPEEMLYVGDNVIDFRAANGAGLRFTAIISGFPATREDFLQAGVSEKCILDSIRDLPKFLGLLEG